jgi:two-component system, OmpR family, phosphate regulon sensor histidine kinase PhoR
VARKSSYYDKLVYFFKNFVAFMPLIIVGFGLMVRQEFSDNRYYSGDMVFLAIASVFVIAATTYWQLVRHKKLSKPAEITLMALFHVLTGLFVLFVGGFLSAFLSVWILFMIAAQLRFGLRGFFASFGALLTTGVVFITVHSGRMDTGENLEVIEGAFVVAFIAYVIGRILSLVHHEQLRLADLREQELYQRERLMALVNSMGDAVIATDETGEIKVYNSTFLNLLDTNLDLAGRNIKTVLNLQDTKNHPVDIVTEALEHHGVYSREDLSHQFSDGDNVRLYINIAPIQPGYHSRAERGFIFILRDITKQKSLEEERDEFVSVVSHELRTPVTIAEGNLSNIKLMFERGADQKMIADAVENSHEQILYLAKLVNDLATLARAERGTAGGLEQIDLVTTLKDLYATYQPQAQAKGLALNLDIAPKVSTVVTNKLYLQEILQNFMTNAIKYTREGSVIIRGTQTKEFVAISVADTGIGISKADQKRIFEKFYRSEDYRTRESNGTGLGLYVTKKLAAKIGLRIEFESRLNHGSTFTLIAPVGLTPTPAPDAQARAEAVVVNQAPDSTHSDPSN